MREMNAITFKDIGIFEYGKRIVPEITNPTDVLVSVEAASICGTDVHLLNDPPGFIGTKGIILGHECVGKVQEIGPNVGGLKKGDRVVLEPNIACGYCTYCRRGVPNMCENDVILGVTIDGVFADYFVAPERALVKVPTDMPPEIAVFAEPVNCVMGAMNKIRLLPGQSALVLGAGPIGLYFTMLLKSNGAGKVIVSEPSEFRREYAKKIGADIVLNPKESNLLDVVKAETEGLGTDVTVDAVGILSPDAIRCTARAGKIVLFGQNGAVKETICQNDITRNGLTVLGNYIGLFTLTSTVKMLESALIPVERIITHKLPLSDFSTGLDAMRKGTALEVILYPDR
ncbi:MAG: alcohol dehydrogenase catalytic domain-containing protein [Bacteroidales bacterium]|jgi:threonine dehydrogenase-like Zn-dependent dehydrogenase|nr:alcohol dehydrogenase catalytic domain-containing protein [Bacteroidales bacterium]